MRPKKILLTLICAAGILGAGTAQHNPLAMEYIQAGEISLLEKNYKTKPILYTNRDFYTDYFADEPALQNFPLWIAHYRVEKLVLPGDAPWMFWQHNDRGSVAGIRENVDFNTFRGDKSELINLCIN